MTLPTHALLGLIIGKATGNYSFAIVSSVLPDIDHFQSYIKSGLVFRPQKLWGVLMSQEDQYGDQRGGVLHNAMFFIVSNVIIILLVGGAGL